MEPPPHALSRATAIRSAPPANMNTAFLTGRTLNFGSANKLMPPISIQKAKNRDGDADVFRATEGAAVLTLRVAVPEPFAVGVTEFGLIAQEGARFMLGVTAQVRFTALLNAFADETVMLDMALFPAATTAGVRAD